VLLEDGARPAYVVTFLAWSLVLLFADQFRRVGHWGPVSVWHGRSRLGVGSAATTRSARRLAAASLGIAAFFPWLLPGFSAGGILQINGSQGARFISIDPIVDIRPQLISNSPVELFTVQSSRAAYWRFLALDQFDGRLWKSSNIQASGSNFIASAFLPSNNRVDTGGSPSALTEVDQRFQFERLTQPWLPAAYDPVAVAIQGAVARYDPEGQFLVAPNGTFQGFTYQVRSQLVAPSPTALDALPPMSGPEVQRYTRLPPDTPRMIYDIAHRLADSAENPYRKTLAIQDYLKSFRYDIRVRPGHGLNDILYFLTSARAGYCEQFAGSMAVMLRALGIPARVAVGFTPGTYDPKEKVYRVTSQNAHAWVEVLFPKYGWLAFEPTPTRNNPVASPYVSAGSIVPGVSSAGCPNPPCSNKPAGKGQGARRGGGNTRRVGIDEGVPRNGLPVGAPFNYRPPPSRLDRWRGFALRILLGVVVLLGLSIPVVKWGRRRVILARARQPRDRILAAYEVLTQQTADLGLGRRTDETPIEYQTRLKRRLPTLDGPLDLLTRLTTEAAYADHAVERAEAEKAFASARRVIREVRRATGRLTRLVGLFRLERYALPR
jgi:transglutaminase-like putative cysteine protease